MVAGKVLRADLAALIEFLSDTLALKVDDIPPGDRVMLQEEISRKFCVSMKTIQRWRKQGLISLISIGAFEAKAVSRREMVFDDTQRMAISAYMAETVPGKQTPAGLARHLGLSHDYFSRIFRRSYGASPRTWLLRQRLAEGAMLLRESTQRVSEIAERLGYGEVYLFSRQFRQVYGVGPRGWRKAG